MATQAVTYYVIQRDDVGERRISEGDPTPTAAAQQAAALCSEMVISEHAELQHAWGTYVAAGGYRLEIGEEDEPNPD